MGAGEGKKPTHSAAPEHGAAHGLHWETSPWLVLTIGILFLLPFAFHSILYTQTLMAMLSLGIGVPLTVISIAGWISECGAEG